jgi:hypothetical protein
MSALTTPLIASIDTFMFLNEQLYVVFQPDETTVEFERWESVEKLFETEGWLAEWSSIEFPQPLSDIIKWADDEDDAEGNIAFLSCAYSPTWDITTSASGVLTSSADMTVAGDLVVSGNLTVVGDLIVKGKVIA